MAVHLTGNRSGFGQGFTAVTTTTDPQDPTGIAFGVLKLARGTHKERPIGETAWLLMSGEAILKVGSLRQKVVRSSLFDEGPSCLHVAADTEVEISCEISCEFTVYATANRAQFTPRIYLPEDVEDEQRGKGQVGDTCHRVVRTIFDRRNADPAAELVLGEVLTFPGRWSSYPPHHHPQPEIYHYRFTHPQGYGHAELGDKVLKVYQNDTVKIFNGFDHPQCAAPGYGMYYAWVIRHLPDNPYTIPEFTPEHQWVMKPDAKFWQPHDTGKKKGASRG
ncbi:MAG: 5-deoxy-glucuronate isomerase [Alphaproteobacteria bacterium]